jgi:hypothetical protein
MCRRRWSCKENPSTVPFWFVLPNCAVSCTKANYIASAVEVGVERVPASRGLVIGWHLCTFVALELAWWPKSVGSLDDMWCTSIVVVWVVKCMCCELSVLKFLLSKFSWFSWWYVSTLDAICRQLSNNIFDVYCTVSNVSRA